MSTTINPSTLFNPTVVTVVNLFDHLKIKVSKTSVRDYLSKLPNYPRLNLADVSQVLGNLKIKNSGLMAVTDLTKISVPALTQLSETLEFIPEGKTETESIKVGVMVAIIKVSDGQIRFIHPVKGESMEPLESFYRKWNNIVVVPSPDETSEEEAYDQKVKREILSNDQYIKTIHCYDSFISDAECKKMIDYCEANQLFDRSGVGVGSTTLLTKARTSFSAKLPDRELFKDVFDKVSQTLNCSTDHIENLQCVRYHPGQEYRPHFDSGGNTIRKETLLVYLNDDFTGGETYFPEINHKVCPKKGSCLHFKNLDDNLNILPQSVHAGLPVHTGVKYACNIWISPVAIKK